MNPEWGGVDPAHILSLLFQHAEHCILILLGRGLEILDCNRGFLKLTGCADKPLGEPFEKFLGAAGSPPPQTLPPICAPEPIARCACSSSAGARAATSSKCSGSDIRDDKGYWSGIEAYIKSRTGTDFSHGICPECTQKHLPDLDLYGEDDGESWG